MNCLRDALKSSVDTYQVICINSSHLIDSDKDLLDNLGTSTGMIMKRDTGWFVKLYEDLESNYLYDSSNELKKLFELCHAAGYRMIEFDCDASFYHS